VSTGRCPHQLRQLSHGVSSHVCASVDWRWDSSPTFFAWWCYLVAVTRLGSAQSPTSRRLGRREASSPVSALLSRRQACDWDAEKHRHPSRLCSAADKPATGTPRSIVTRPGSARSPTSRRSGQFASRKRRRIRSVYALLLLSGSLRSPVRFEVSENRRFSGSRDGKAVSNDLPSVDLAMLRRRPARRRHS